jgi:outer membrane lipoprotein-sorting protein
MVQVTLTVFLTVLCELLFNVRCEANQSSAQDIISKAEQNFLRIENYRADVSRIYYRNGVEEYREEWRFFFQNPGLARVELMFPKEVTLVINQNDAWQHIQEEKKVWRRGIKNLKEKEKILILGEVLKPYEIEGWGISLSSKFGDRLRLRREETVKGRKCFLIECSPRVENSQQLKLLVWIDQERLAVVRKELHKGADRLVSRMESENFLEIIPGIWLPRKVNSTLQAEKGEVVKQLVIRNIKVNQSMPEKIFQFIPPQDCEVVTFDNKSEIVEERGLQDMEGLKKKR